MTAGGLPPAVFLIHVEGGDSVARRRQGTTPSSSISSEKLRNVRTSTMSPSVAALSIVWSMAPSG